MSMLLELGVSTCLLLATVVIHGVGLGVIALLVKREMEQEQHEHLPPLSFRSVGLTSGIVLGLTTLHGIEIWGYALFYLAVGAVPDLQTAVYLSTMAYTTVGASGLGRRQGWEMVAAIEGINGVILLGWSTAFFVMVISRLARRH